MIKKFMITLFMLVLLFSSVNAVTYLNSCGKETGWTYDETYILNFTEVKDVDLTPLNTCFTFADSGGDNITFTSLNNTIFNNNGRDIFRFDKSGTTFWTNVTIKDLVIISTNVNDGSLLSTIPRGAGSLNVQDFLIKNVIVDNMDEVFVTSGFSSTGSGRFNDGELKNSLFTNMGRAFLRATSTNGAAQQFRRNEINNVLYQGVNLGEANVVGSVDDVNFTDSVMLYESTDADFLTNPLWFSSLTNQYTSVDTNNNNVDDSPTGNYISMAVRVDILDYTFIQDVAEGMDITPFTDRIIMPINDEVLDNSNPWLLSTNSNNIGDSSFATLILNNFQVVDVAKSTNLDCVRFNSSQCLFQDQGAFTTISGNDFRGMIVIAQDTKVNNLDFTKVGSNNAHIISNNADVTYDNITITNNET